MKKIFPIFLVALISSCSSQYIAEDVEPEIFDEIETTYPGNWETSFYKKDLGSAAMDEFRNFYLKKSEQADRVVSIFDGNISAEMESCADEASEKIIQIFLPYLEKDTQGTYLVSGSGDWIVDSLESLPEPENGWPVQIRDDQQLGFLDWAEFMVEEAGGASTTFGFAERNVIVISPGNGFADNCSKMKHLVYHETFHMVSLQLDKRTLMGFSANEAENFGAWFVEGSADFFAYAVANVSDDQNYYGRSPKYVAGDLSRSSSMFYDKDLYGIGTLAIEFLVANAGVDSVMNVYRYIGEGYSFPEAFEKAMGISLENFYLLFDKLEIMY